MLVVIVLLYIKSVCQLMLQRSCREFIVVRGIKRMCCDRLLQCSSNQRRLALCIESISSVTRYGLEYSCLLQRIFHCCPVCAYTLRQILSNFCKNSIFLLCACWMEHDMKYFQVCLTAPIIQVTVKGMGLPKLYIWQWPRKFCQTIPKIWTVKTLVRVTDTS